MRKKEPDELFILDDTIALLEKMAAEELSKLLIDERDNEFEILARFSCFNYALDTMREIRSKAADEAGNEFVTEERQEPGPFPYETLEGFEPSEEPATITMTLKAFAELSGDKKRKMIAPVKVNKWLQNHGYLDRRMVDEIGKEDWYPTDAGEEIGICAGKSSARGQDYMRITYNRDGQLFMAEHLEEIENEMVFAEQ